MDVHIDWLSWTVPTEKEPANISDLYYLAKGLANEHFPDHARYVFEGQGLEACGSRTPYRIALAREDNGLRIYGNSHTGTVLFELTGRGCAPFHDQERARDFIAGLAENITRIDLAVDIRTGTKPADFSNARSHQVFRSITFIRSDTGETCYVGSPKSDRFCRVYRYNPPHPRSDLLRVEFVFRRGLARLAAQDIANSESFSHYVARLGNTWGWEHKDWQPEIETDEKVRGKPITRENDQTVRWLYSQVAPAMRRLMTDGALDLVHFIAFVYGNEDENPAGD